MAQSAVVDVVVPDDLLDGLPMDGVLKDYCNPECTIDLLELGLAFFAIAKYIGAVLFLILSLLLSRYFGPLFLNFDGACGHRVGVAALSSCWNLGLRSITVGR